MPGPGRDSGAASRSSASSRRLTAASLSAPTVVGLPLSLALAEARAPETLLADSLDAAPLPAAHGGPLRLVVPSQLGYKNVKWVVRLEVTATRAQGYWERNGDYPSEAPVS